MRRQFDVAIQAFSDQMVRHLRDIKRHSDNFATYRLKAYSRDFTVSGPSMQAPVRAWPLAITNRIQKARRTRMAKNEQIALNSLKFV